MTDTDRRTEPAIPPEEWPEALLRHRNAARSMLEMDGNAHRRAALDLYDQPFGFTWEDVDVLRDTASEQERYHPLEGYTSPFRSLADRLAALLPPR